MDAVTKQITRIGRKTDELVDSGQRMKMDSKEALRVMRQAEFDAISARRQRETTRASWWQPTRWFRELLHH